MENHHKQQKSSQHTRDFLIGGLAALKVDKKKKRKKNIRHVR